ncbi:MAG TPA: response regulator [Candidatus Nitrosotenuis sp.]|nr:response regulator [Candidatus Nitrosotenuis sp.]
MPKVEQDLRGRRILVVDDDEHIRKSLSTYLGMEEFAVDTAASGAEALSSARANPPDLMVLDIMMPEMDGFEVVEALRAEPSTARVPIILLTARGQDSDILRGYQLGVSSYLTKPFNLDELVGIIREVFQTVDRQPGG